jgi:sugar phosphate isomerase/epimerase
VYAPGWDPTHMDADSVTLDFSHAALSGRDGLEMAMSLGDRLRHIHLCDASGAAGGGGFDQHMIPGRGTQPVAETLRWLADSEWTGQVVAEVHTHLARTAEKRMALLRETVEFARAHTTGASIRGRASVTDTDPAGVAESV